MAYEPINWQTGDTITAEKLNKMDNGWSVTTERTTLFDGEVTTVHDGGYNEGTFTPDSPITADSITVTFNGTEYGCQNIGTDEYPEYGAPYSGTAYNFSEFPFNIYSGRNMTITTETAGTYTLKIERTVVDVEKTNEFAEAVSAVVSSNGYIKESAIKQAVYQEIPSEVKTPYSTYAFIMPFRLTRSCTVPANGYVEATFSSTLIDNDWKNASVYILASASSGTTLNLIAVRSFVLSSDKADCTAILQNISSSDVTLSVNAMQIYILGINTQYQESDNTIIYLKGIY